MPTKSHIVKHPAALEYANSLLNDSSLNFSSRLSKLYEYYKIHPDLRYLIPPHPSPNLHQMEDSVLRGCFLLELNILKGLHTARMA